VIVSSIARPAVIARFLENLVGWTFGLTAVSTTVGGP
jgi:hypothetical protein